MRHECIRLWNRYVWRFILPMSQMNGAKVQLIVLLVIVPSVLAGILVAQAAQSRYAVNALFGH
jgi:hypothetical protein